jgi:hypothetical protein
MPPPPNRQPSNGNGNLGAIRTGSPKSTQVLTQPTNTDLIEMAANQSIQEEAQNNGGIEVVKKVNINF